MHQPTGLRNYFYAWTKNAGPLPRACQITSICFNMIFNICFNTCCNACFSFFASTINTVQQPIQFLLHRFRTQYTVASTAAQTTVSCLRNAHARLLLQGPPDLGIGCCLNLAGHFFWSIFWNPLFHSKLRFLMKIAPKIDPKWGLLEATFQKTCEIQ